jgi:hypothetical protein
MFACRRKNGRKEPREKGGRREGKLGRREEGEGGLAIYS